MLCYLCLKISQHDYIHSLKSSPNSLSFFQTIVCIELREFQRWREMFHSLLHSPEGCNIWNWANSKPGASSGSAPGEDQSHHSLLSQAVNMIWIVSEHLALQVASSSTGSTHYATVLAPTTFLFSRHPRTITRYSFQIWNLDIKEFMLGMRVIFLSCRNEIMWMMMTCVLHAML